MLLTIADVTSQPGQVLVTFDGPSPLLTTAWEKQWEPWSKILSIEGWPQNFKAGMIILWSGSIASIPTGWHLCDGTTGTPDLRNRFIVCANADVSGVAKSTIDGAAKQTGGEKTYSFVGSWSGQVLLSPDGQDIKTVTDGNLATYIDGEIAFTTESYTIVPPFYALAYIMKV